MEIVLGGLPIRYTVSVADKKMIGLHPEAAGKHPQSNEERNEANISRLTLFSE